MLRLLCAFAVPRPGPQLQLARDPGQTQPKGLSRESASSTVWSRAGPAESSDSLTPQKTSPRGQGVGLGDEGILICVQTWQEAARGILHYYFC